MQQTLKNLKANIIEHESSGQTKQQFLDGLRNEVSAIELVRTLAFPAYIFYALRKYLLDTIYYT